MLESPLNTIGIFSMGNMNPVSNMVGSIIPNKEIIMADCCDLAVVLINKPIAKEVMMKREEDKMRRSKLPLICKPRMVTLKINMSNRLTMEMRK